MLRNRLDRVTRLRHHQRRRISRGNPDRFIDTETILSHVEEQAGDMHKTDKSIDVDAIKTSNHDVDDPRKGTKAPENNVIYPSNSLQGNKGYKTKNEVYDSTTNKAAGADEKAKTSTDSQRSEIVRRRESHEKTVAHHTLNKMTNKEIVITESKFMIAEIVETIVGTQTSETHVHWDIIEVWDSGIDPHEADQDDQIETGIDVAR